MAQVLEVEIVAGKPVARRAIWSAAVLAIVPPETKSPPAVASSPISSASQRMVWFSITVAACAARQPPGFGLSPVASASASVPTWVPPPFTQPKKRGLPWIEELGRIFHSQSARIASSGSPCSGTGPSKSGTRSIGETAG